MYFFIYFCISLILPIFGWMILRSIKKQFAIFFLVFTIAFSIWLILYFLFFGDFLSALDIRLFLSRFNFLLGLFGVYNILFFVHYYDSDRVPWRKIIPGFIPIFFVAGYIYVFTDSIIPSLVLETDSGTYREVIGAWYDVTTGLYILFLILLSWTGWRKIRTLSGLEKVRLGRILVSIYALMSVGIILQLILPSFGVHIFEKEFILLPAIFVVYTYFTLRKYYFNPVGASNSAFLSFFFASTFALLVVGFGEFLHSQGVSMGSYWQFPDPYDLGDVVIGILIFFMIQRLIGGYVFRYNFVDGYKEKTFLLEKKIAEIYDFRILNDTVSQEISKIFRVHHCCVVLLSENDVSVSSIRKYFESGYSDNILINDMVFLEQRKDMALDIGKIREEIEMLDAYIIFPLMHNDARCIGYMMLGRKNMEDYYSQQEIEILRSFSYVLAGHIRYIFTYLELQEFSQNLDKKVDEKTMEYNDLINKQKEFISTISHEIKSPIAGAILQTDSIMDDLCDETISRDAVRDELNLLSNQLVKVGDLISKLFSVQYYDTHSVTLFKERVQIQNLLNMEIDIYETIHENVEFSRHIDSDMRFIEIDKIQFQQVVTNLVSNAIKFANPDHPCIHIEASIQSDMFIFSVEDNGDGLAGIEASRIFEKYAVGISGSVGLGIGLYLCRRIVEMHKGSISGSVGTKLGGVKITVRIPL